MDGKNIFLTGRAGTGKSYVVKQLMNLEERSLLPLAPTGIAALNLDGKGSTLHSFFGLPIDITVESVDDVELRLKSENKTLLEMCDGLIIDEISMVRADMFDILDKVCQRILWSDEPFGGKQLVCVGDLYQLPPIVRYAEQEAFMERYASEFFFSSVVYDQLDLEIIELEKIYRQSDQKFITTLNSIRIGAITDQDIDYINQRVVDPQTANNKINDGVITLTPTKTKAEIINQERLKNLDTPAHYSSASVVGKFSPSMYPNDQELIFKEGAQIMIIKNIPDCALKNGQVATITSIMKNDGAFIVGILLPDGQSALITESVRDVFKPKYNQSTQVLTYDAVGSFTQLPFKLGRASTIHKSQGLTFDAVIIDLDSGSFATGQTYVALSRASSLEGLTLSKKITRSDIITDYRVSRFMRHTQEQQKFDQITDAIASSSTLQFIYKSPDGSLSEKEVIPKWIYRDTYEGYEYLRLEGYCKQEKKELPFNVQRVFALVVV